MAMMSCSWEGNRRSGVALTMHHRLQWFIHLPAQWLTEGPAYTPLSSMAPFTFTFHAAYLHIHNFIKFRCLLRFA